jgi:glutaredoxin
VIVSTEGAGHTLTTDQTILFGAEWCADCRQAKSWLRRHDVPFTEHDVDADPSSRARATAIAGGRSNIPVLLTPDGTVLVEPTNVELASALGAHSRRTGRSRCR